MATRLLLASSAAAACFLVSWRAASQPCATTINGDQTIDVGSTQKCGTHYYGTLTVVSTIDVTPFSETVPDSGWLHIKAQAIVVTDRGQILANGRGFRGSSEPSEQGVELRGPGAGGTPPEIFMNPAMNGPGGGGAHIGIGGQGTDSTSCPALAGAAGGLSYGSAMALSDNTLLMGSAGGASRNASHVGPGGHGGGAIILEAQRIEINGAIASDGEASKNTLQASPGGGGGGSIVILTDEFTLGASATLSANGGEAPAATALAGGGGGGGLIVLSATGDFSTSLAAQASVSGGASAMTCCTISAAPFSCGSPGLVEQISTTPGCIDADGDGAESNACGGPDCHDGNPEQSPDGTESCDGVDNDCDDAIDEDPDGELCSPGQVCGEQCDEQGQNCTVQCVADDQTATSSGAAGADEQYVRVSGGLCASSSPVGPGDRGMRWALFAVSLGALSALARRRRRRRS